jgi:hypothetical protein
MAFVGKILQGIGLISTPKAPPAAPPPVQYDDAAAQTNLQDQIDKRRGGAADIITGAAGAGTPLTGGKLTLGS